jgi:guanyl-specific ribonuclease Sa
MFRATKACATVVISVCALAVWGIVASSTNHLSGQVTTASGSVLDAPPIQLPANVPSKVGDVLRYIDEHGQAPPGFVGGRVFTNDGRSGEEVLPRIDADGDAIGYHEWDVNRRVPGKNRGTERLITGSDGGAYFTNNHYKTFIVIRGVPNAGAAASTTAPATSLPPVVALPPQTAAKINSVLSYIRVHGTAMPGYVGGRDYHNSGQGNGEVLPRVDADGSAIAYQEWDVNPRVPGQNRGVERLITGSDGSAYYTDDHYKTFKRVR